MQSLKSKDMCASGDIAAVLALQLLLNCCKRKDNVGEKAIRRFVCNQPVWNMVVAESCCVASRELKVN